MVGEISAEICADESSGGTTVNSIKDYFYDSRLPILSLSSDSHTRRLWNHVQTSTFATTYNLEQRQQIAIFCPRARFIWRKSLSCSGWEIIFCEILNYHIGPRKRAAETERKEGPTSCLRFTCPSLFKCHRNISFMIDGPLFVLRWLTIVLPSKVERAAKWKMFTIDYGNEQFQLSHNKWFWTWQFIFKIQMAQSSMGSLEIINVLWLPPPDIRTPNPSLIKQQSNGEIDFNLPIVKWLKSRLPFMERFKCASGTEVTSKCDPIMEMENNQLGEMKVSMRSGTLTNRFVSHRFFTFGNKIN